MPIYLLGSLQYFADVRAANASIDERLAIFFCKLDESINQQIADSVTCHVAEASGSSGDSSTPQPLAGAAAAFDWENQEAIAADQSADARTALSVGEGR